MFHAANYTALQESEMGLGCVETMRIEGVIDPAANIRARWWTFLVVRRYGRSDGGYGRISASCGVNRRQKTCLQLSLPARNSTRKSIRACVKIVLDGQDIRFYFNILSGVVKLTKVLLDGRQQIVGLQFTSNFIGRLFTGLSHTTVEAATPVKQSSYAASPAK